MPIVSIHYPDMCHTWGITLTDCRDNETCKKFLSIAWQSEKAKQLSAFWQGSSSNHDMNNSNHEWEFVEYLYGYSFMEKQELFNTFASLMDEIAEQLKIEIK